MRSPAFFRPGSIACLAMATIIVALFVGCNKEKAFPPPPPDPQDVIATRMVKGKIEEYYQNRPIPNAEIKITYCRSVTLNKKSIWRDTTVITDVNGEIFFDAEHFRALNINLKGYWLVTKDAMNYTDTSFAALFPGKLPIYDYSNINFFPRPDYACDSFFVKLIPQKSYQVHMKDSSLTYTNGMVVNGYGYVSDPQYAFGYYADNSVFLRPGIDTVLQFLGYGNFGNEINAFENSEESTLPIIQKSFFIRQETDTVINIVY